MNDENTVDERLIAAFNAAGAQARAGRHEESLAGYREVLAQARKGRLAASREFLATTRMRAGFCLMDLGRYEESLAEFAEARKHRALGLEGRYELEFATGNALGALGRLPECFSALVEAISLAEDLDDYTVRPARCWMNILEHGRRAGDHAFVRQKASIALDTARLRGMKDLEAAALNVLRSSA